MKYNYKNFNNLEQGRNYWPYKGVYSNVFKGMHLLVTYILILLIYLRRYILQYIMYTKWKKKELQKIMANSKTQQQQNKKANIEIIVRTWNQTRD